MCIERSPDNLEMYRDNKCYSAIDWYLMEADFFTRINHIKTVTDMSRVIVNSGHPAAKLSFSDERHVDIYATTCTHKIGKKERKKEINLICRELFHCIHAEAIFMFTHDNENAAVDLFILQDLFCHVYVKLVKTLALFLSFANFRVIITTYTYRIMCEEEIAKIQGVIVRRAARSALGTFAEMQSEANPISQRTSRPTCRR